MNTLPETEQHYQQLLKANPNQASLWCLLGETRLRLGKLPEAMAAYQNALRLEPAAGDGHFGLAGIYKEQGQRAEAILSYRRGLANVPDHGEALLNLGVLLAEQGQLDEALGHWQRLLRLRPEHAQAHQNVGVALAQKGQHDDAIRSLERALELKPDYAEACCNLANVLCNKREQGPGNSGQVRAVALLLRAVTLRPGYIDAYHNLGAVLIELGRAGEAEVWLRQAVRLCEPRQKHRGQKNGQEAVREREQCQDNGDSYVSTRASPRYPDEAPHPLSASSYNQLGLALAAQGKYAEAEACYYAALDHNPAYAEAQGNLGNLFQEQGRLAEALACYDLALVHDPQSAATHWNRALGLLQTGDYERGWREYEWRWQRKQTPPRPFRQPRWDGAPLAGRTLLVYMEQGLGDMLQFIRYAGLVEPDGGKVVVECPSGLVPLFGRCRGIDRLVAEGTALPAFDVQAPLMSLPGLLGTKESPRPLRLCARVPPSSRAEAQRTQREDERTPYLFADESLVESWRERLAEVAGFKVGIVWQGNPRHRLDRYRSVPLIGFASLARVPGVQLVSLQKGPGADQVHELAGRFEVVELRDEVDTTAGMFMDTAAIMMNLDLVISVDTAAAHLAGGLEVPVWVPLSAAGEWRWLLEREDSPWYPSMRLFRQKKLGDWRGVFRRMGRELTTEAQRHRAYPRENAAVEATTYQQDNYPIHPVKAQTG